MINSEIKVIQNLIQIQDEHHMNAMENFEKAKNACRKDSLLKIMKQSSNNVKELRLELNIKQAAVVKISAKNLKWSDF